MNGDYQNVLNRLKEERRRRSLTQRMLCYHMKMQQSHYSQAETGHRRFSYQEMKGLCTSDVDVLYVFTGITAKDGQEAPASAPEELICHLNIIYHLASTTWFMYRDKVSLEKVWEQLNYLQWVDGNTGAKSNIFLCARNHFGYTQRKMADILGVDIKKLRDLEKGKLLPDSEIIWKMYHLFRVSPAFILKDAQGLRNELNFVLGLLDENDRAVILQILENTHEMMWRR